MHSVGDLKTDMREAAALNRRLMRTRSSLRGGSDEVMTAIRDLALKRAEYVKEQLTPATIASMASIDEVFNNELIPNRNRIEVAHTESSPSAVPNVPDGSTDEQKIQALEDLMYDQLVAQSKAASETAVDSSDQTINGLLRNYEDLLSKLCADKKLSGVQEIVANRVILSVAQQTSNASLKVLLVSQVMQPNMKEQVWLNMVKAQARKDGQSLTDDKLAALKPLTDASNIISQNALTLSRAFIRDDTPESFDISNLKRKEAKIAQYAVEAYLDLPEVEPLARKLDDVLRGGAAEDENSTTQKKTSTWMEKLTNVSVFYLKSFVVFSSSLYVSHASDVFKRSSSSALLYFTNTAEFLRVNAIEIPQRFFDDIVYEFFTDSKMFFFILLGSVVFTGLRYVAKSVFNYVSPAFQTKKSGFVSEVVAFLTPFVQLGFNNFLLAATMHLFDFFLKGGESVDLDTDSVSWAAVLKAFWIGVKAYGEFFVEVAKILLVSGMLKLWLTDAVVAGGGVVYVAYQAYLKLCTMWYERPRSRIKQSSEVEGANSISGDDVVGWIMEYCQNLILIPYTLLNKTIQWAGNFALDYVIKPLLNKLSAWFTSAPSFLDRILEKLNMGMDAAKLGIMLTVIFSGMAAGVTAAGVLTPQWANIATMFTNLLSSFGLTAGSNSNVVVLRGGGRPIMSREMWGTPWVADIFGVRLIHGGAHLRVQRPVSILTAGYCYREEEGSKNPHNRDLVTFGIRRIGN